MTIKTAYIKFLEKVNKNFINDNIAADLGRFILIFNEEQNRYLEWVLEKRNEDEIRYVQKLLVCDEPVSRKGKGKNTINFSLPENYFDFSSTCITATKDGCTVSDFKLDEVKTENLSLLLTDHCTKPDFLARETFYTFGNDCIKYYIGDFEITEAFLTYYRCPKPVDIEGYIRVDNTNSQDIDPELNDKIVDRIITATAARFDLNTDNLNKVQFNKQDIYQKI